MDLIQVGNTKLKEAGIVMFNIPAGKAQCGRACDGCYAIREQKRFPVVLEVRTKRYEASQLGDFVEKMSEEILRKRKRPKVFRVHSSGDMYSQEYVDKWVQIAKKFPDITFYAYTKRKKAFNFDEMASLNNFILIDSMQHGKVNYGSLEDAPDNVFICPDVRGADVVCGKTCTYCMTKQAQHSAPYFKKH